MNTHHDTATLGLLIAIRDGRLSKVERFDISISESSWSMQTQTHAAVRHLITWARQLAAYYPTCVSLARHSWLRPGCGYRALSIAVHYVDDFCLAGRVSLSASVACIRTMPFCFAAAVGSFL
jgi:hypothetical protein